MLADPMLLGRAELRGVLPTSEQQRQLLFTWFALQRTLAARGVPLWCDARNSGRRRSTMLAPHFQAAHCSRHSATRPGPSPTESRSPISVRV